MDISEAAKRTPYFAIHMRTKTHIVSTSLICQTCGKVADTIQALAKMHQRSTAVGVAIFAYDENGKASSVPN